MKKIIKIKNKIKKKDLVKITYITMHLKYIRKKIFIGYCSKLKKKGIKTTITLKKKKNKTVITKIFFINAPIILTIKKIKKREE